jgi:hypothetical protein
MREGTVNVFIVVVIKDDPDEMIEVLTRMGYTPLQYQTGDLVRTYSLNMLEDDLIMLKLLSIPGAQMHIGQVGEE